MLRLMDTRTRQVEDIVPSTPGLLTVYACGPTVYRYAHVGNLRTFLLTDLIRRTAEQSGLRVKLVQNITDVGHLQDDSGIDLGGEDKLLAQARAENKDPFAVARFYEDAFHADLAALNVRPADSYPRASEWIPSMISLIEGLIHKGHAYEVDGSVYFAAQSFDSYGAISGNRLEDLRAGHGATGESTAEGKRFHADWALWKAAGEQRAMTWESPWGYGFPGWHTECSAMSVELLGERIDVHTGGIDLRFPHHEDERAQSDSAVGHEVVNHWVHGEHLLFEGRKMAKSTGNVVLVSDVAERGHDALALRLAFLQTRYRQQANLSWAAIEGADRLLTRWRGLVAEWAESPSGAMSADVAAEFREAFEDDLDTPRAVQALRRLEKASDVPDGSKLETFLWADSYLGVDIARDIGKPKAGLPDGAQELLDQRTAARAGKDFGASDRLRDELAALGVAVKDTKDGQTWSLA
ncbi:MAG: cysteine--tRNA ligase [Actinobacteria bacterium]|nr:cysteine--tRNA ligase [Actinomycetota bacterium]MCA1721582.1 cysteine--tRNA ligase [Actinomycetota bacterium]